jgi:hypothetical protein
MEGLDYTREKNHRRQSPWAPYPKAKFLALLSKAKFFSNQWFALFESLNRAIKTLLSLEL